MARPRWKRFVVAVMFVVVVPIALLAAAAALLPTDRLAAEIAAQVQSATGGVLQPGQADIKLLGGLGLMLTDGSLRGTGSELAQRTGAGQDIVSYDLTYSRLEASLSVWPLLKRQVRLRSIRLEGPQLRIELADGAVRLKSFEFLVTDLQAALADIAVAGATADRAPGEAIPGDLSFGLRVRAAVVEYGDISWTNVAGEGAWSNRALVVESLTGRLGEGNLAATGRLDYATDPWGSLTWQADLHNLPSASLLAPYLPGLGDRLLCGLSGEVTGSMSVKDAATRLSTLVVTGSLTAGEGVLHAEEWLQGVARYLGTRQDLSTVRFGRLSHELAVRDGRYEIGALEIDGHDTDWQATGWLGLGSLPDSGGRLEVAVGVRLPAGFTPDLGSLSFLAETMRDQERRVNLGLKIGGQLANPTVGLDLAALNRRR